MEREKEKQNIRFLFRLEQKQRTRALYEQVFSDDRFYVDYYYREKCRDNVIVIKEETDRRAGNDDEEGAADSGAILSMVHLNPYLFSVCGLAARIFITAAVATAPDRRREGHMRDVLAAAFDWLEEQGVPFTVLLPVDPAIYAGFGFEPICSFTGNAPAQKDLAENYDVYCIPDLAAAGRRAAEKDAEEAARAAGLEGEGWPENMPVMARVTDRAAFDRMAGKAFADDAARLSWLRSLRICISDGV